MHRSADISSRRLLTFFGLAFFLTWVLLPLSRVSVAFSLLALLGPAAAALITAALSGRQELRDLGSRIVSWKVPARWYLLAFLLPVSVSALGSGFEYLWGAHGAIRFQQISVIGLVVFVLVVGEEIGWRGFALPRLLGLFGPWSASAILGSLWAFWHLPLFFLSGMPQFGTPFVPHAAYTIALSLILTFLAQHTRGSVVIATLFHGAVNTFGLVNTAADSTLRGWGNAVSYGLVALMIGIAAWNRHAGLLDRVVGVRAPEPPPVEPARQMVFVTVPHTALRDHTLTVQSPSVILLEQQVKEALVGIAEVNAGLSQLGTTNIELIVSAKGSDADRIYTALAPVIEACPLVIRAYALVRYGESGAREIQRVIGPPFDDGVPPPHASPVKP